MIKTIHNVPVHGLNVGPRTECQHWYSELDIVAIQFPCCQTFYPCRECHDSLADHPTEVWTKSQFAQPAILCGNCGNLLSISAYQATNSCPKCEAAFNPGCHSHSHLYFETD